MIMKVPYNSISLFDCYLINSKFKGAEAPYNEIFLFDGYLMIRKEVENYTGITYKSCRFASTVHTTLPVRTASRGVSFALKKLSKTSLS